MDRTYGSRSNEAHISSIKKKINMVYLNENGDDNINSTELWRFYVNAFDRNCVI